MIPFDFICLKSFVNEHTDHLGSIINVFNPTTYTTVCSQSFDAWGNYRDPGNWNFLPSTSDSVITTPWLIRGYTGHEQLPNFGLINMNGRTYDPLIANVLSPDPVVQFPESSQGFQRYSYCANNPLRYTDPTGYDVGDGPDLSQFIRQCENAITAKQGEDGGGGGGGGNSPDPSQGKDRDRGGGLTPDDIHDFTINSQLAGYKNGIEGSEANQSLRIRQQGTSNGTSSRTNNSIIHNYSIWDP